MVAIWRRSWAGSEWVSATNMLRSWSWAARCAARTSFGKNGLMMSGSTSPMAPVRPVVRAWACRLGM
ncbi:Uncharacterised protein [Mycobacteroides abscessus subsp. abscessus]|nr:Uncharacterised protein [Mycobacteroides abscessus subsp. abscessus]